MRDQTPELRLNVFKPNQQKIESAFILLAAIHRKVLELFDECFDQALRKSLAWQDGMALFVRKAETLPKRDR